MQPPLASVGRYRKGSQELNLSIFKIKVNQNSAQLDQIRTSRPLLSELVAWPTAVVFTFLHFQTVRPFLKMKSHVDCPLLELLSWRFSHCTWSCGRRDRSPPDHLLCSPVLLRPLRSPVRVCELSSAMFGWTLPLY